MIKAIIFDCFGVLTTDGWEPYCRHYFSAQKDKLKRAKNYEKELNLGHIRYDEFLQSVASLAEVSVYEAKRFIDDNTKNKQLFSLIRSLKTNYKIGLLSNAGANWLEELFNTDEISLFDDIVLSCEVGLTKPDIKIYQLCVSRLGIEPAESILIDNSARYCEGAKKAGLKALQYESYDDLIAQLTITSIL